MRYRNRLVQQFNLGLDLLKENDNPEVKTNLLINKAVNDLAKNLNSDSIVIFHSNDDTISLICYKILKVVQLSRNFKLYLYGSRLHTNKWISKEDKFINRWKVVKLLKSENTTLAIPYNPLYKVVGTSEKYNKFLMNAKNVVRPVEKFNLQELSVAQIFYHIGYIKTDPLIAKNMGSTEYWRAINMCKIDKGKWDEINDNFSKVYPPGLGVYAVWLTGDLETDTNIINIVENVNGLIFYYYNIEGEYPRILKSGFEYWLNNPVNTPVEEVNINSDIDLFEEICNNVYLIGDFPKEIADKICSGTYNTGIVEIEGIHFFD